MYTIKKWLSPHPWANLAFLLLLVFFVGKQVAYIDHYGATPLGFADGFSESHSRTGAENFLKLDPWETAWLPVWPNFGMDTDIEVLKESKVYTHFFPGPDYVLTLVFKLFGVSDESFQWARLVPFLNLLIASIILLLSLEARVFRAWPWAKLGIGFWILFTPAMKFWVINLHGHSYSTALMFYAFSLGLWSDVIFKKRDDQRRPWWWALAAAFGIGFLSNYMLLTGCFMVFAAPVVANLLVTRQAPAMRPSMELSFVIGLGLVAAFIVHFWQVAIVLDSWALAWHEQIGTAIVRAGGGHDGPTRLMLIGQYSHHVRSFFLISALSMVVMGCFFIWLQNQKDIRKWRQFGALMIACVAGYLWIMAMKQHSIIHPHVNPRVFMLLYLCFVALAGSLAADHALGRRDRSYDRAHDRFQ